MKKFLVLIGLILCSDLVGQSVTSYQFYFNPLPFNPAFTGHQEVFSASAQSRFQSLGLKGAPSSQAFVAHARIPGQQAGVGMQVWNLSQGVNHQTGVYGSYAYYVEAQNVKISAGIRAGVDFSSIDYLSLRTRQGNDPVFSQNDQFYQPNVGVGVAATSDKFRLGVSIPAILESENSTISKRQYLVQFSYKLDVTNSLSIRPSFFGRLSDNGVEELVFGPLAELGGVAGIGMYYNINKQIASILYLNLTDQVKLAYSANMPLGEDQIRSLGSHEIGIHYLFKLSNRNITSPRYF